MNILIVAATHQEIQPFRNQFPEVETLITGVGTPFTIFHLQKALQVKKFDFIFQVGIGGSYDQTLIGNSFIISDDRFADIAVYEQGSFVDFFQIGLCDANDFPFKHGWLENQNCPAHFPVKKAVSVNMLTDDSQLIDAYKRSYQAEVESMEGAAFHYVCLMNQVPFIQIRGISNLVGERNKQKWKMQEAIDASNQMLIALYHQIKHSN